MHHERTLVLWWLADWLWRWVFPMDLRLFKRFKRWVKCSNDTPFQGCVKLSQDKLQSEVVQLFDHIVQIFLHVWGKSSSRVDLRWRPPFLKGFHFFFLNPVRKDRLDCLYALIGSNFIQLHFHLVNLTLERGLVKLKLIQDALLVGILFLKELHHLRLSLPLSEELPDWSPLFLHMFRG